MHAGHICASGGGRQLGDPTTTTHSGAPKRPPSVLGRGMHLHQSSRGASHTRRPLANLRAGRTAFDFLGPVLVEERIRTYGHKEVVAVHTTLLSIGGRYSGRTERAQSLTTPSGPPPRRLGAGHQSVDADQ